MNAQTKPIQNLEDWTLSYYLRGYIEVLGDEEDGYTLRIPPEVLDAAWQWLSSRYDEKSGAQCLDFISDELTDEFTDKYAGKLLRRLADVTDPEGALKTARELRHHYCARKIGYYTEELARRSKQQPDPMTTRKDKLEVRPYVLPRLLP